MHKTGSGVGYHHGNPGGRGLEHRGHSLEEDFLYSSNPTLSSGPSGGYHKRWSVPSGMYTPQPAVGGFHPNSSNSPELPSWGPRGGMAGLGNPGGPVPNFQPMAPNKKVQPSPAVGGGGGGSLSLGDPWHHWISPVPTPQCPPSVTIPQQQQKADFIAPSKVPSPRLSRSLSVTLEEQWISSGGMEQDSNSKVAEGGGGRRRGGNGELQQLMKSLDINSEHMLSLKVALYLVSSCTALP